MPSPLRGGTVADPTTQQNFEGLANEQASLAERVSDLEGESTRGTGTLTWSGSTFSATKEITHGLGTTPTVVICTSRNWPLYYAVEARGETTFTAAGGSATEQTGTYTFDWVAYA